MNNTARVRISIHSSRQNGSFEFDRGATDLLKFVSCVLIALHHYAQYAIGEDSLYNSVYYLLAWQGGYIGVAVFFLLSGYGLMKSEMAHHLPLWGFVKKRILRVYLPVATASLLWMPVYAHLWPEKYSHWELFLQAMGGGNYWFLDGVMWFVRVLLLLYTTFFVFSWVRKTRNTSLSVFSLVAITLLLYIFVHCYYTGAYAVSIPFFAIGVLLANYPKQTCEIFSRIIVYCCFLMVMVLTAYLLRYNHLAIHAIINWGVVITLIFLCCRYSFRVFGMSAWIGRSSFDVYLVHHKVQMYMISLVPILPLWMFAVATAIATIVFYWIRKILNI